MKITVWGGAGFLGSHIADTLTKEGHSVTVADKIVSPWLSEKQKMFQGDILDIDAVSQSVRGANIVFNCSGIADIHQADQNPFKSAEVNILGNLNLLSACANHAVRRYVFASSLYVYSTSGGFYRCSKQACESYIEEFNLQRGLNYTILRFGSLYGPRSDNNNAIYRFINSAIKEKEIKYWGKPDALRDYVHIYDAAQVCGEIIGDKFQNENIIISGTQTYQVENVLKMIAEILGNKIEIKFDEKSDSGHYEKTPYSFTPRLAKKYVPNTQIDFGQGLLEMIELIYSKHN